MLRRSRFTDLKAAGFGLLLLAAAACAPTVTVHGYYPLEEDIALIEPGVDTILTVEERLGRPSTSGVLRDDSWYYVQTTLSQLTYNPAEEVDRKVLAVSFREDGVVESIDQYGLEDGRIVNLNPRVTETPGQRLSLLRQIFGNLLNINAEDFFN